MPGFAEGAGAHAVGLLVAGEGFGGGIEGHFSAELPSDGGGVAGDVGVAHDVVIGGGERAGFYAVEEFARVVGGIGAGHFEGAEFAAEGGGENFDRAVVAGFDPAFVAFEADGAGAGGADGVVAGFVEAGGLADPTGGAHDEFHAVGVASVHGFSVGFVGDGRGVVGAIGPLAEVDGVGAPVEELGPGIEVVVTAPAAVDDVGLVVGPPR